MRGLLTSTLLSAFVLLQTLPAGATTLQLPTGPDVLEAGEALFVSRCARCHGLDGSGSDGPTLRRPTLFHAATDAQLLAVVRRGIPGTDMPSSPLTEEETVQVASYVRSLGRVPPEPLPGDPNAGRLVYDDVGCEACHILGGAGRAIGPELTSIGAVRGVADLRQSLVDPRATVGSEYLFVRARLDSGEQIEGLRINEDSFSIQLRDANGRLHSVLKEDLATLTRDPKRSIMRSYARSLSTTELDDLVSYLASLRSAR